MYACPVCNGFQIIEQKCPSCNNNMDNQGRLVDYMGDYIAYLDYDGTKLIDGTSNSLEKHICIHLYHCLQCGEDAHVQVQELKD